MRIVVGGFVVFSAIAASFAQAPSPQAVPEDQTAQLRTLLASVPKALIEETPIAVIPPRNDWEIGMVSWVAAGRDGLTYLIQRNDKIDPVIALDRTGKVVRSWGRGVYRMPHAIRIDPQGNVWTTDAATSEVTKFSPEGKVLLTIAVGGVPSPCRNNFCGTTDVAFGPAGHVYVADGYANARIVEYTADGSKVREWGEAGTGPGQFRLPHSIQIDDSGIIYVADRENGRIQRFDLQGRFLSQWDAYGKTMALALEGAAIWLASQPRNLPNGSPGWLIKVDRSSGRALTWVDSGGSHGLAVAGNGELLYGPGRRGEHVAGYSDLVPSRYQRTTTQDGR